MTYDPTNRKDIRAAEKAADLLRRAHLEFLTAAMSTPQGRAWFYTLLASCQCYIVTPTFNPHADYFDLGRKSVGLPLMADLQTHCPNQYLQMMSDENVRLATASERSRSQDRGRDFEGRELDDPSDNDFDTNTWGPDNP